MRKISLVKMKRGEKTKIVEISGGPALQNRFMGMGIYTGREIAKVSQIALRGPVTIRVGRTTLALGHGMAGKIFVETV